MHNKLNLKNNCPECYANIIHDSLKGELVCSVCGYVIEEQVEDYGQETYSSTSPNKKNNPRASGFNSISYHDFGLHTEIDHQGKDYSGKGFDIEVKKTVGNLRKWNSIIRISNSKERRLSNVLTKINEICSTGSFPKVVCDTAALLYRNYENKCDTKGKSSVCMAAATIFYACKICSILRSLTEIINLCTSADDFHENLRLSSRYYRSMVMFCEEDETTISQKTGVRKTNELQKKEAVQKNFHLVNTNRYPKISNIQTINISQYISKLSNLSRFDSKTERLALELAKKTENHLLSDGKSPNGIAAAYIYLSSILLGINILQMDISRLAGVTEVTIRNRCKDILTSYRFILKIKPTSQTQSRQGL